MTSWGQHLLTGHADIDAQHRAIFDRLDQLHVAMLRGDRSETTRLLEFLGVHVLEHFAAEEKLMRETGFPAHEEHRQEHEAFAAKYLAMRARLEARGASAALMIDAKEWIVGWATQHICERDAALAVHLGRTPASRLDAGPAKATGSAGS